MSADEKQLASRLRILEQEFQFSAAEAVLPLALASENNRLVGRAASLIAKHQLDEFEPELLAAFERFLESPLKTDRGCEAKTPICEALRQIDCDDADFFLQGMHYRQYEPGYGGDTDTAAELRAICGFALIQMNDSRALSELVDLLGDTEKTARAGAARAIAHAGGQTSELLLRLKISLGDAAPEVLGECFAGLMRLDPERSLPRIARFLEHASVDVRCEAALALGESRSSEALRYLREQADRRQDRDFENVLLTSIGLLGTSEAVDYLLQVIPGPDTGGAIAAIRALRHARDPRSFADRLLKVVDQASNRQLDCVLAEEFPECVEGNG